MGDLGLPRQRREQLVIAVVDFHPTIWNAVVDLIHRTAKSHQPTCKNPARALLVHSQVQQIPAQLKVKLSSGSKRNRFGTTRKFATLQISCHDFGYANVSNENSDLGYASEPREDCGDRDRRILLCPLL